MKKFFFCLSLFVCLFFSAGCEKKSTEPKPAAPTQADSRGVADDRRTAAEVTEGRAVQYTLTYNAGDNGSLDGAGRQTVKHGGAGSTVTAVPAEGYHFVSWSDGSTANPRSDAEVTADLAVTASFAINQYTLVYSGGKNGSLDGAGRQTVSHGGAGSTVTAVPAEGYHFVNWSDGSTANPRSDADVMADLAVTANFAVNQYTLTYTAGDNGSISGAGRQTVNHGGAGRAVTAVPAEGYHFVNWSDGSTANPRSDADVTADLAVTADFAITQHILTYVAGDNGSISGVSRQKVNPGSTGSAVTAVPNKGYHFVSWSDGSTANPRTDAGVTSDIALTANFAINTYTVSGTVAGLAKGNTVILQNRGGDDLTVTANGGFTFATGLPDNRPYAVKVTTQPTSPNQTCTVTRGEGKIPAGNVTDISVECVINTYTVGGTVFGLPDGDQLVLQNNKSADLVVTANGNFTFEKALDDGSAYEVAIHSQRLKPKWFCRVENSSGSLAGSDVTSVDVACFPEVDLLAVAGNRKIDLKWNSQDFSNITFNLCRAQEDIPVGGFSRCAELKDGVIKATVSSPHTVSKLINETPYWLQLEVRHAGDRRTYSEVVNVTPFGGLNDTGIDWCADNATNRNMEGTRGEKTAGCQAVASSHPGQDANQGRDAAARARKLAKSGRGSAGFDFTKVCMNGEVAGTGKCPPNPTPGSDANNWACTLDNLTGLVWEVKSTGGLRSQTNTYSWYNPNEKLNGGVPGVKNGGKCTGSGCDTHAYAETVNAKGLCGANDWRLPTRRELLSIVDNGRFNPAIDSGSFPNTSASYYWTASTYAEKAESAWQVYFRYGEVSTSEKGQGNYVRLVRYAQ